LTLVPAGERASSGEWLWWYALHRVKVTDLAVFTRQMASLLRAGLPLSHTVRTLGRQTHHKQLGRVCQEIEEALVRDGATLAEALDRHPRVFGPVYRGLVRAGEEGGNLVEVLDELAKHLSQTGRLRGQVLGAFVYPAFLLVIGLAAVFVLMTTVIPQFEELFESFGEVPMPGPTRVLMAVSRFMSAYWWAVLIALAMLVGLGAAGLKRQAIRKRVDRLLLLLPVVGPMVLRLEIARVARTLAALLDGGVRILDALRVTAGAARNLVVKETFPKMADGVRAGEALVSVAERAAIYPPLVLNLIRTGEDTGELPEMLGELSQIYEDEAERAVRNAVRVLEPMLIIGLGGLIACIVAAILLPVFRATALVE
jgi:type II secretory pathway component PulF